MSSLCEDCGGHASWQLESTTDQVTVPPRTTRTWACDDHRLDVTERVLSVHGNVTICEVLG